LLKHSVPMGKGGAKGSAKGKGGGGQPGRAAGKGDAGKSADSRSPEEKRQAKKAGRRADQLAKVDAKGQAEADYFWECKARSRRGNKAADTQSEAEVFGRQGTFALDFSKYDSIEVTCSGPGSDNHKAMQDFADLGKVLPSFLARNLELMSYRVPTPIQKHALPFSMKGSDLMCCAQTGSGKTAAFLLPVVASLSAGKPAALCDDADDPCLPRCVVMAPTRELIQQIHIEALKCCHNSKGLRAVVIYGGANMREQLAQLAQGCDIAVATPGRLTDFVDRGLVELRKVEHLVLDEADRMLDMGFEPQIRLLVQNRDMPGVNERRTVMFSATFPSEIQKLAKAFMKPYVFIAVGRIGGTTENIEQRLVLASAEKRQKFELVLEELKRVRGKTLIFVQKKRVATQIKKWLRAEGVNAEDIHGDRSQSQREAALASFRSGETQILCATDVAARGLDIPKVEHVINFDLPTSPDEFDAYVHRIGRTGRAGNTGVSTSFYVPGYDPKVGNAGIAQELARIFKETSNELPDWFLQLPESSGLRSGKANGRGAKNTSQDARSGNAVRTQTATKAASNPTADATPAAFQNPINSLETAARKQGLDVHFEESADPGEGFWCEAVVSNRQSSHEVLRVEAWNSKKKDAKHEAAKACLASMDKLPSSNGATNGMAPAKRSVGGGGGGNVTDAAWRQNGSATNGSHSNGKSTDADWRQNGTAADSRQREAGGGGKGRGGSGKGRSNGQADDAGAGARAWRGNAGSNTSKAPQTWGSESWDAWQSTGSKW